MSDDVTIPRETARTAGEDIRLAILTTDDTDLADRLDRLADLLDPPQRSLRDEVYTAIWDAWQSAATSTIAAASARDAVLAVMRKHIEALTYGDIDWEGYTPEEGWVVGRDDVLLLLGGGDE